MKEKIKRIRKRLGGWKKILGRIWLIKLGIEFMMDRFAEMIDEDKKEYNRGNMKQEHREKFEELLDKTLIDIVQREIE